MSELDLIVLKHGSSVVSNAGGNGIDQQRVYAHVNAHQQLREGGFQTVEVASGAVLAGIEYATECNLDVNALSKVELAKMGTARQIMHWQLAGDVFGIAVEQVLATHEEIDDESEGKFIVEGIKESASKGFLSVVNENNAAANYETKLLEAQATEDKLVKADNDWLAAHLSMALGANTLMLLTNTYGLLTERGRVRQIQVADADDYIQYCYQKDPKGTGGMKSKLLAAAKAAEAGVDVIIGSAFANPYVLLEGESGTRVVQ